MPKSKPKTRDKILSALLIISILVALVLIIYVVVTPKKGEEFTEFYILNESGKAAGYPSSLSAGEQGNLIIGVGNHEYENVSYLLRVVVENKTIAEKKIRLPHNETVEFPFSFTASGTGAGEGKVYGTYLFRWQNVPGDESEQLLNYLVDALEIEWAGEEGVEIFKSADEENIFIVKDENFARIVLDTEEERATVKISGSNKTYGLKVKKKDDGWLDIYGMKKLEFLLFRLSGNPSENAAAAEPYRELHLWFDIR
ncbi:MAG: hypothetical protein C4B55_06585 [Candidatus Methanophagaceae archaeon]|nr:MAG: hypothetical protein C4B55_06585 [Methanophagales archaeon]